MKYCFALLHSQTNWLINWQTFNKPRSLRKCLHRSQGYWEYLLLLNFPIELKMSTKVRYVLTNLHRQKKTHLNTHLIFYSKLCYIKLILIIITISIATWKIKKNDEMRRKKETMRVWKPAVAKSRINTKSVYIH